MIERLIARALQPVYRLLRSMLARGAVVMVNSAAKVQRLQVSALKGELKDGVEHFESYGFTANPKPGAECLTVFLGGDRSSPIVIATPDGRYRLKSLASGEVALYDDLGQVVHLKRDGILVETPLNATLKAGQVVRLEGDIVSISAKTKFHLDVNGYGHDWVYSPVGDTYHIDTWKIGNVVAGTAYNIAAPEHP